MSVIPNLYSKRTTTRLAKVTWWWTEI